MLKRAFDIVGAAALIVLTLPVLVLVSLAIRAHDGGPALYRQTRIGKGGLPFEIYKFRTMVANADKIGGYSTADGDSRITPVGRTLRRYSIDELPQLFNVLRGDMSLVGPRPDVPAQRSLYSDTDFMRRHSVRPGITGLAQATLRSSATQEQRMRLDLEYVDKSGVPFDMMVLILTLKQVFTKGGN